MNTGMDEMVWVTGQKRRILVANDSKPRTALGTALVMGHLLVNFPAVMLTGTPMLIMWLLTDNPLLWILSALIGLVIGWLWWSATVPRWRRWALHQGLPPDKLQRWAALTGLVWPKGWLPEKTEFRVDDNGT